MSEPENPDPPEGPSLLRSLHVSDRIALAALGTAVLAGAIGVVQTGFMWAARNDEVEAALRAEQLRGCVAYRMTGVVANERAQFIARDGPQADDKGSFDRVLSEYRTAIAELSYLLPQRDTDGLQGAEEAVVAAYNAFLDEDYETLARVSSADGPWAQAHNQVLDACEQVIRDVRDR